MGFWSKLFGSKKQIEEPSLELRQSNEFLYELLEFPGTEAISALERLRQQGREKGFTPVLLGNAEDVALLLENMEGDDFEPEEILGKANTVDIQAWFDERAHSNFDEDEYENLIGEWTGAADPIKSLTAHLDILSNQPKKSIFIAKIPTVNSWEVPAFLNLGGWNECPMPEHQVAVSKYWHDLYSADIAAITGDTTEYLVNNPPKDREAAITLAREQFAYCEDIVIQGVETISNLAGTLCGGKIWYFWWD